MRPKVIYWFDIPTPTPMGRCNAVADLDVLDFEVWFNRRTHGWDHQIWAVNEESFRFHYRYVRDNAVLGCRVPVPLLDMRESKPDLIVQDYWPWNLAAGVLASKWNAQRTALRVLPNYDAWSHRTAFGELAKHFIFHAIDGAKVPGPDGIHLAARYGLPESRTACVSQTIDVPHFSEAARFRTDTRNALREKLGLSGVVFVFVGRLWSGKGLDFLFDAYERVASKSLGVSLLLVGDGPDEARYRDRAAHLPNVAFAGWVGEAELPQYLAAGDVLVFPTLGDPHGLVVEEAMVAGLPVISSDRAGDIALRLRDGESGYVVPAENAPLLAERMCRLLDPPTRALQAAAATTRAQELGHHRYAQEFVSFVRQILEAAPRKTLAARSARLAGAAITGLARPVRAD